MRDLSYSPSFVHFFGPDGSGKSTQADLLVDFFERSGIPAKKCWLRSPHTFAFLLWRIFVRIGFYRGILNPFGYEIKLPAVDRRKSLRYVWALIEFFSVLPIIIRIRLLGSKGYKLIAERYVLDTVTTIAFFIGDISFLRSNVSRLLFLFIPRDTAFIFLDSNFETVFGRRAPLYYTDTRNTEKRAYGAIPKSAVEPREFIDFQRTAYRILAKSFNALTIDTSKNTIEETSYQVQEFLKLL